MEKLDILETNFWDKKNIFLKLIYKIEQIAELHYKTY